MKKFIKIYMANHENLIVKDITEAIDKAKVVLKSKHGINFNLVELCEEYAVCELESNNKIDKIGYHLRGITSYLLKNCEGYENKKVNKKVLDFYEIDYLNNNEEYSLYDSIELIQKFSELFKLKDKNSIEKINKIKEILEA